MKIRYVLHKDIDFDKWDKCIANATNSLIYAYSFYLNAMAKEWDALIYGDYEMVMPLPFRKKWFVNYIYPPAFIQQLGVFSNLPITKNILEIFISNIPPKFKYADIYFNYGNAGLLHNTSIKINYILNLNKSYDELKNDYSRSANRNIAKALLNNLNIAVLDSPLKIIALHRKRFNDEIGVAKKDYDAFAEALIALKKPASSLAIGAFNGNKELIAGNIYLLNQTRLTFILTANTKQGMQCGAAHFLKDYIIKKFSGQNYILDFEGSDHKSFARFYEQFNAKPVENYYKFVLNRLSWPLKYFK